MTRRAMTRDEKEKRQAVIDACRRMNARGITQGTSGNISAVEVETLARQYHGCQRLGEPPLLSRDEIERVRLKMVGYGHANA